MVLLPPISWKHPSHFLEQHETLKETEHVTRQLEKIHLLVRVQQRDHCLTLTLLVFGITRVVPLGSPNTHRTTFPTVRRLHLNSLNTDTFSAR